MRWDQAIFQDSDFKWSEFSFTFLVGDELHELKFRRPQRMWESVLSRYGRYCPNDSGRDASMLYNSDVIIAVEEANPGYRVDIQLPHMSTPWVSIYCDEWVNKEEVNYVS